MSPEPSPWWAYVWLGLFAAGLVLVAVGRAWWL